LKIHNSIEFCPRKKPSQQLWQTIISKEVTGFLKQILPAAATYFIKIFYRKESLNDQ
jgi:hypothetical protein